MHKALGFPTWHKLGMVAHTCNPSPWEVELDLEIQGLPWVQNQPMTPAWAETYLKKTNKSLLKADIL